MTVRRVELVIGIVVVALVALLVVGLVAQRRPLEEPEPPAQSGSGQVLEAAEAADVERLNNATADLEESREELEQAIAPTTDLDARSSAISDLLNRRR